MQPCAPEGKLVPQSSRSPTPWLVGLLLFIYSVGGLFPPIYKNLGPGDIWLGGAYLLGLFGFHRQYAAFFAGGYGLFSGAILLAGCFTIVALNQGVEGLTAMVQFATILLLLLPLVAVGIAEMKRPLRLLQAGAWVYFAIVSVGAVLLFGSGSEVVFKNSGANRYFLVVQFVAFEACVVPLALVRIFALAKTVSWRAAPSMLLIGAAVFASVVADSRTGMLVAITAALLGLSINRRPVAAAMIVLVLALGYVLERETTFLSDLLGIEHRGLLDDSGREEVMVSALHSIDSSTWSQLLLGVGWQGSGFVSTEGHLIVHNTFLQVAREWGLIGFFAWAGVWLLPWYWIARSSRAGGAEWQVAFLTMAGVYCSWMFHPIATTRNQWLGFAMGMGLAYRVYRQQKAGVPATGDSGFSRALGGPSTQGARCAPQG